MANRRQVLSALPLSACVWLLGFDLVSNFFLQPTHEQLLALAIEALRDRLPLLHAPHNGWYLFENGYGQFLFAVHGDVSSKSSICWLIRNVPGCTPHSIGVEFTSDELESVGRRRKAMHQLASSKFLEAIYSNDKTA